MHATDVRGQEVLYEAGGVTLKGYLAWDANKKGKRPGILVVHEWWGHNNYARRRARMLAELGYTALALDMYGNGKHTSHPADAQKFMQEAIGNQEVALERFQAAEDLLKTQPTVRPDEISAIGYCFGGGVVLSMARAGLDLDLVASFHGSLSTKTPAQKGKVHSKVLVLHGEDDAMTTQAQLDTFMKEMKDAEVDLTFHAFPGAKHSFTNPESTALGKKLGLPIAYNEQADRESWEELVHALQLVYPR